MFFVKKSPFKLAPPSHFGLSPSSSLKKFYFFFSDAKEIPFPNLYSQGNYLKFCFWWVLFSSSYLMHLVKMITLQNQLFWIVLFSCSFHLFRAEGKFSDIYFFNNRCYICEMGLFVLDRIQTIKIQLILFNSRTATKTIYLI